MRRLRGLRDGAPRTTQWHNQNANRLKVPQGLRSQHPIETKTIVPVFGLCPSAAATPPRQFYRSEIATDYCAGAACTGLRNTPIPATLISTTLPATSGPTPAGVPVAITSPGQRVIMREIQRTRNAQG